MLLQGWSIRRYYGYAVELAEIIAFLAGFYATSPYISGYVIPESRVGSAIGVFYAPAVERVEAPSRPLL